jgi:hypothetical protein
MSNKNTASNKKERKTRKAIKASKLQLRLPLFADAFFLLLRIAL